MYVIWYTQVQACSEVLVRQYQLICVFIYIYKNIIIIMILCAQINVTICLCSYVHYNEYDRM